MTRARWKRPLAEVIGTFTLVFAGAGAIIANQATNGGVGLVGIAFAHGLALAVMVSALGMISGGHFNPAVTCGFLAAGRIRSADAIAYILAQLVGATLAALALWIGFPGTAVWAVRLGTPALGVGTSAPTGMLLEAIGTFFLVIVVFGTVVHPQGPRIGGLGIGLVLTMDILAFGPLTGAAVNPARAFGPAFIAGAWSDHLVYWIGPLVGGLAAGWLYSAVYLGDVK